MLVGPHFHRLSKPAEKFWSFKLSKSCLFHLSRDSFATYFSEDAMALQDVSLGSAVGEVPFAWHVHFSAADVEAIQLVPGIVSLRQLMLDVKLRGPTGWRPVLAHHTTTACQPRKQTGTVDSLKDAGLENVIWRNNQWEVTTVLANAFVDGDRISIEAVGSDTTKKVPHAQ